MLSSSIKRKRVWIKENGKFTRRKERKTASLVSSWPTEPAAASVSLKLYYTIQRYLSLWLACVSQRRLNGCLFEVKERNVFTFLHFIYQIYIILRLDDLIRFQRESDGTPDTRDEWNKVQQSEREREIIYSKSFTKSWVEIYGDDRVFFAYWGETRAMCVYFNFYDYFYAFSISLWSDLDLVCV